MTHDLISRAMALEVIEAVKNVSWSQSEKVICGKMYSQIKDLPSTKAVDAAQIVHGRWQEYHAKVRGYSKVYYQHSCTPLLYDSPYYYCPNCGAKMDGEA